ncbi:type II toxin-antitoxin system Phd/YefM family antitoxin [Arcanobacterium bovis]|uniref:Antitoxin n=1 Tax=Arcanobacterium bovis TaxID=2529275 RepID=A0A4Q9V355_9ACTO|nr:type II toxin-antitoxin system Phd/YefM family antitoxin [Arcanobacterium bovis]TBW22902.1 type II toxin-antitoxin system Phd/YefM family antitoxin [Arcanobacterium bovis]
MAVTLSAREFNQDVSAAKRAAADGPVVITDRGNPAFVLMSIDDYKKLSVVEDNLISLLSMREASEIEFEFEKAQLDLKVPEF